VTYQPLDVLTMLGFVILIGVVVNNAILVVHQTLNFMDSGKETDTASSEAEPARGLAVREAIRESVRSRVRPIMMSMLTTTFGLLPLVMSSGAGSELYRGIGSVVLGGLIISTVFTLLVVPSLFSLLMEMKLKRQQQRVPRKVVATGMSEA
jgi:HAE1 family hydrophobic/amphiphilic exporter-1